MLTFALAVSRFYTAADLVAVRNLWWNLQRNLRSSGPIYVAPGYERYCIWISISTMCLIDFHFLAKGYLGRVEEDPAAVVCLGDSAYGRSNVKDQLGIGRPVPQRNDGVQQKVRISLFLSSASDMFWSQGEEVAASHKVQSVRVVVEQTIRDLKCFKIMTSNKINAVSAFEEVLDCVTGLHNLRVLLNANPNFDFLPRRAAIPREHVFQPLVPQNHVDLKIPADAPDLALPKHHDIRDFKDFLTSAAPAISRALEQKGASCIFFPTVKLRGKNLYNGAYILQLRLQKEVLDVWTVKYIVGASYSYETHTGYVQMSKDDAALNHICDCYSG